jgi:hypothetical protein
MAYKRLRRIPNAWHFRFDSALVFTAQYFRLGGSVAHHLTRLQFSKVQYAECGLSFKVL